MVNRPDNAAVARILDAVGTMFVPASLNREELCIEIDGIASLWVTGQSLRTELQASQQKRAAKIIRTAEDLKALLEEHGAHLKQHCYALDRLIADINRKPELLYLVFGLDDGASEIVQLVGLHLSETFKFHFSRKDGSSKAADGTIDGPFIRFAEAVLRELAITNDGKPYARKTLANALTAYRAMHRVQDTPKKMT